MTPARRLHGRRGSVVRAGLCSALLSGAPSTAWALLRHGDPLAATRAAGTLVLPGGRGDLHLLPAAAAAHVALSVGWAGVLDALLPRPPRTGRAATDGALAGLAIAAVDLGIAHASRRPRFADVRALPVIPQLADHVAFGVIVAVLLRRGGRAPGRRAPAGSLPPACRCTGGSGT